MRYLIFAIALFMASCTAEELLPDESMDINLEAESSDLIQTPDSLLNSFTGSVIPSEIKDIAYHSLNFFSAQIENGNQAFFENNAELVQSLDDNEEYTFQRMAVAYKKAHDVPKHLTMKYLNSLYENQQLISKDNFQELFIQALQEVALEQSNNKWLLSGFVALAESLGANVPCELSFAAAFGDAVLNGAATIITAPTGAGLVIGAASTAGAYANMISEGIDCFT